jgi:spore coat polysaccharide biosynthesis predicted glycosyltransferase SpsG
MRYVFRADASLEIGSGHVMRTSAIAEEVIARGLNAVFVGEVSDLPWVSERIQNLGFREVILDPRTFNADSKTDILILDSYTLDLKDNFINVNSWYRIVTIFDDTTPQYPSNLIIKNDLLGNYQLELGCKVLTGPTYFPLRKIIEKSEPSKIENTILDILVVGGGTDIHGFAEVMCQIFTEFQDKFTVRVFTNKELRFPQTKKIRVSPIGAQLDKFASKCDLVFTTASTTAVEFIAREKPTGVVCAVNNQEQLYESLIDLGIAAPIGKFENGVWKISREKIHELIMSKESRESLRRNCVGFMDFKGASRIVDEIQLL